MDTNMADGETQVICGPCLPAYALGMAAAMTEGLTPEQSEAYAAPLDQIRANDARPQATPKRQRRSQRATEVDEPDAPDELRAAMSAALTGESARCLCEPDDPSHPGLDDFEDCHCACHEGDGTSAHSDPDDPWNNLAPSVPAASDAGDATSLDAGTPGVTHPFRAGGDGE